MRENLKRGADLTGEAEASSVPMLCRLISRLVWRIALLPLFSVIYLITLWVQHFILFVMISFLVDFLHLF